MNKDEIVIYSNGNIESVRLMNLVSSIGLPYIVYELDNEFTMNQFVMEFGEEAEFPQANCGYKYIGSLKEILAYFKIRGIID